MSSQGRRGQGRDLSKVTLPQTFYLGVIIDSQEVAKTSQRGPFTRVRRVRGGIGEGDC